MPIEIHQLEINVSVTSEGEAGGGQPQGGEGVSDQDFVVALAVERVMELLREQQED